jgi:hypothetical protein
MMMKKLKDLMGGTPPEGPYGLVAQFGTGAELVRATRELRRAGYRRFEAFSPYPVHGLDSAMGSRFSLVPFLVFGGGVTGALAGLALQVYVHAINYPLIFSGKPFLSIPAFIPVMFELTILFAAFGAVVGMFAINRLPMLYHPLLAHERFLRVANDGFYICVESRDPLFDLARTQALLETLGGGQVERVEQ